MQLGEGGMKVEEGLNLLMDRIQHMNSWKYVIYGVFIDISDLLSFGGLGTCS